MGQSSQSERHRYQLSPTIVGERTCRFLRRLHPARTVDNVVADLHPWSIKASTIAKMLERQTAPGTVLWVALTCTYGPEFLSAVFPTRMNWLDEATRRQRQQAFDQRMAALKIEFEDVR